MSCRQRGGRVGRISAIAATSPSSAADVCHTTSITSDPENAWIARRQSAITAALEQRRRAWFCPDEHDHPGMPLTPNGASISCVPEAAHRTRDKFRTERRLSGESARIGEGNWDETSPFGERVGYL